MINVVWNLLPRHRKINLSISPFHLTHLVTLRKYYTPKPCTHDIFCHKSMPAQNLSEHTFMLTTNSLVSQNHRGENILFFYRKEASKQELQKTKVQTFKMKAGNRVPCPQLCQTRNDTACFCNCQPYVVKSNKNYIGFSSTHSCEYGISSTILQLSHNQIFTYIAHLVLPVLKR